MMTALTKSYYVFILYIISKMCAREELMPAQRRNAFLCRRFTPNTEVSIQERYDVAINEHDSILTPEEIAIRAKGHEILFVSATERITTDLITALSPSLQAIATLSVGFDHIDTETAQDYGIHVLNTPDVLSDACAEIALMLILNACRRGYEADRLVRSGDWQGWAPTQLLGKGLTGQRLGIFGMGRIGRCIAHRARNFGVSIHYHNRRRLDTTQEEGATYHDTLESLIQQSDIFVISVPGAPHLQGMIDEHRLSLLPSGAVLINISRGDLVDDEALLAALDSGSVAAAGLDVFAGEPNVHPGYSKNERVFLTPHIGSATEETRDAMGALLVEGLDAIHRGDRPANQVV